MKTTGLLLITVFLGIAGCSDSSSDAAISGRVKAAISKEPALKGTKVSVATEEKVVHLSGTVKSRSERAMLIAVARKVEGVKAVKPDLVVPPQASAAAKPQQKPKVVARAKPEPKPQQRVTRRDAQLQDTGR